MAANDVLLLIGHGSVRYPDAGDVMRRHADRLREAGRFVQVESALLNGEPSVAAALARIDAGAGVASPTLRVVPFFMEDGYFTNVAIPRALGGRPALLCRPVGVHDGIAGLIERHALAACDHLGIPSRSVAILVVGHGSASEPGRALALHRHTARVAATELFARVEAACLEEAPFVTAALRGLRAHPVVVVGCFANQGGHVRDDLPALIAAEQVARRVSEKTATPGTERGAQGDLQGDLQGGASGADHFPVRFHGSIAADPAMLQIIIDQAEDRD